MGRTVGRSAQDTRRALLDAAEAEIRLKGVHAALDGIARRAGVSKGGLIYHFASKDDLIMALAADRLSAFRKEVADRVDPTDTTAGRWTRAYLETLLAPVADEAAARESLALIAQLMTIPEVAELAGKEAAIVERELAEDGLPASVTALVVAAADGLNSAPMWGASASGPQHRLLGRRLVELTRRPQLWDGIDWADPEPDI